MESLTVNVTLVEIPITSENWKLFVVLIVFSSVALISAVTIYLLLWDKQNIHGWTQFSYLISTLLFNLAFIPALCPGLNYMKTVCFILSVTNQYFFIVSKCWLLVIGADILWKLWKLEPTALNRSNSGSKKLFAYYCVFAWVFPIAFVLCGIMINVAHREILLKKPYDPGLWQLVPDYGHLHCRIPNWTIWEVFIFSNCLLHIIIFVLISFVIVNHRRSSKIAVESRLKQSKSNSASFLVFIKLFIVVGLSWSYIALQDLFGAGNINTKQTWGWHLFRIIYFLQGFLVSWIYVGNAKTIKLLKDKYPKFKGIMNGLEPLFGSVCLMASCWRKAHRESISTTSTNNSSGRSFANSGNASNFRSSVSSCATVENAVDNPIFTGNYENKLNFV